MNSDLAVFFLYCATEKSGIHVSAFNKQMELLETFGQATEVSADVFIVLHPFRPWLYSVDSVTAMVSSFRIDSKGELTLLHQVKCEGAPCHIAIDATGEFLLVTSFLKGVSLFSLDKEGKLIHMSEIFEIAKGSHASVSHPHGAAFTADGMLAYVADMGADAIFTFRINATDEELVFQAELTSRLPEGSGPRHVTLAPDQTQVAVVNELSNILSFFATDATTHKPVLGKSISLLPEGSGESSWAAEVAYHPSGKTCYASNRGHDSIAIITCSRKASQPPTPQWIKSGGRWPQHFIFNSVGDRLFVANTRSDLVSIFDVDASTGVPGQNLENLTVSRPTCLAMFDPHLSN